MSNYLPQRHDLVWLEGAAVARCTLAGGQPIEQAKAFQLLADWVALGNPLIVARQAYTADAAAPLSAQVRSLRVGLALPPSLGKWRLAFDVPLDSLRATSSPPPLPGMIQAMPLHWHGPLKQLVSLPEVAACKPLLYGSAGMQALTGLECLSDRSDIDLLFQPRQAEDYTRLLAALTQWSNKHLHLRVDGEVVNPDGWASAWRDCASQADQVLAKSINKVALLARRDFEIWPVACEAVL